jgi:ankyrin repeat protein
MNPRKVDRSRVVNREDFPNIEEACRDFLCFAGPSLRETILSCFKNMFKSITVLALMFSACLLPAQAYASNDGKLCDSVVGVAMCGSLMVIDGVARAVTPEKPKDAIEKAIQRGELEKLKFLTEKYPTLYTPRQQLEIAVYGYIGSQYLDIPNAEKMKVISYLLESVDVTDGGSNLLQTIAEYITHKRSEKLELAQLLIAHGASANNFDLSKYVLSSSVNKEMLELLLDHGADPNHRDPRRRAPLIALVLNNDFESAMLLLNHGADPNGGESPSTPSGLVYVASYCERSSFERRYREDTLNKMWNACLAKSSRQMSFLIEHGADVNGKASPQNGCTTPYDVAKEYGNSEVANTLINLKADPKFGTLCRRSLH